MCLQNKNNLFLGLFVFAFMKEDSNNGKKFINEKKISKNLKEKLSKA
jgi:hypothetical protein